MEPVSFIKIHEPGKRDLTTKLQLNSSIEGLSVLPATNATKLRKITTKLTQSSPFPRSQARGSPQPAAPHASPLPLHYSAPNSL